MNRLRAGYVMVRNPCCRHVVYRVELSPENVDCLFFITKDPEPMLKYLDEIDRMGYEYIFQVTMTPYGREIEPGVRNKDGIVDSFIRLSERIGKERSIWRYDPILFNDSVDVDYHKRGFSGLCDRLEDHTERCIFSFLDLHPKLGHHVRDGMLREVTDPEIESIGKVLAPIAEEHSIEMTSCCTRHDLSGYGIRKRGCLDGELMRRLEIPYEKCDAPLRDGCLCVRNLDIGTYDTCGHNCVYCYANRASDTSRSRRRYDPNSEMLAGHVERDDEIVRRNASAVTRLTDFL